MDKNKVNPKLEPAENRAKQQMVGVLDGVVMQCETEKNFHVGTSATPANNVTQTEKYCYKLEQCGSTVDTGAYILVIIRLQSTRIHSNNYVE